MSVARLLEDINDRFHGFPTPHGLINLSTRTPAELMRLGIPPKPDAVAYPERRRAWDMLFGRPIALKPFQAVLLADLQDTNYRPFFRPFGQGSAGTTRYETSENWSGAYASANQGKQFVQIYGFWHVPDLVGPSTGDPSYACSNWIGLDGQRRYFNSSLPQIGTVSTFDATGKVVASAWTQWWARGNPNTLPVPIKGFTVNPGDQIGCVLTVVAPQTVWMGIANLTQIAFAAVGADAPMAPNPPFADAQPIVAGATAEWILERPRFPHSTLLMNFPDYAPAAFDGCVAFEGDGPDLPSSTVLTPQTLRNSRLLRMFERRTTPDRTDFISMPDKTGNLSVSLKYGGF